MISRVIGRKVVADVAERGRSQQRIDDRVCEDARVQGAVQSEPMVGRSTWIVRHPTCDRVQFSADTAPSPQHEPYLLEHYYQDGANA